MYREKCSPEFPQISIDCAMRNCGIQDSLHARTGRAAFAPTLGFRYRAPHLLSFLFICTLHWCKHCTGRNVAPNFRKFPWTTLCEIAEYGIVCMPILVGAPFAPTLGLHFRTPQPLSFLFICTLHWCKQCTGRNVAPNFRKLPLTALCDIAEDGLVCMPVLIGAPFAPT